MSDIEPSVEISPPEIQEQPYSKQAEEAVLGSVLINPETFYDLSEILDEHDFYIIRNRWIWEAFMRLQERRANIDYLTVTDELRQHDQLSEIGGAAYLTSLINQTPSSLHAAEYGHIVEENSIRRRMLSAANDIAKLAFNREQNADAIIEEAEKSIFGISQRHTRKDVAFIQTVMSDLYDHIEMLSQRSEEFMGVPTGLRDLDRLLGGMQKSDLLIIAGRPGSGKTGFLLSAAKYASQIHKKHVALFSLEMSNEQLAMRLIAQETGIDTQRLRTGKLLENEWALFTEAIEALSNTHIYLDDTPAITPLQLQTKCRRLHQEHQLDLIMVDYLQLMGGDKRIENRVQEVSAISRSLKVLARDLKVPVLAAAQLSRAVEQRADKRPILSDLRESGSLEQDSDVVLFIHRPDAMDENSPKQNLAEIIVAKHRNGPTHSGLQMVFLKNLARFVDATTVEHR
ncbi:MAG: replicative DNA helicase [Anaerolineaceae bacterium]|nr:replicative DNA helicase [Anaerolineaceae bacterium]